MITKQSDVERSTEYVKEVEKMFPNSAGELRYLFLDACYDESFSDESIQLQDSMEELYKMLERAPKLATSKCSDRKCQASGGNG